MAMMRMPVGADVVGGGYVSDTPVTLNTSSFTEIDLGIKPSRIFMEGFMSGSYSGAFSIDFDVTNSKIYQSYGTNQNRNDATSSYLNTSMYVSGTKLYLKAPNSSMAVPFYVMAVA